MANGQGPEVTVEELLRAAARGLIGVDRRLLHQILDRGASATAGVVAFAKESRDDHRVEIDPLLIDLLRYLKSPEALGFFIEAIRRFPDEVDDSLIQALLPFGEQAIPPLLALHEELDEELGADVAFLLAGLRVRDPRVLKLLEDRLEYDAADGAFLLGLYGDAAARPALEKLLAELPADDVELRREFTHALEQLDAPETQYQAEPFDIYSEYPEIDLPPFDVLSEEERVAMFASTDPVVRAGAAYSFFNAELDDTARAALLKLAQTDPEASVRGRAWASLADTTEDAKMRDILAAVLNDESKDVAERGGAAIGLYAVADRDEVRRGLEALYEMGGKARLNAMEAMWRSLWNPYAKYFPQHLDEKDPDLVREALRGTGYFRLTRYADKIASYFDREEPFDDLREDALFAYALAMPGETTRGRVKGMLRKIDALAKLTPDEADLVMFSLDERLRLQGLEPVFKNDEHDHDDEHEHVHDENCGHNHAAPEPAAAASAKTGRNDPCPCGSGKKYKKCHGAVQ